MTCLFTADRVDPKHPYLPPASVESKMLGPHRPTEVYKTSSQHRNGMDPGPQDHSITVDTSSY